MSRLTGNKKDSLTNYKVKKIDENWAVNIQNCINKLGKLEDLEEELGCPLEVVFKALKEGFEVETGTIYRTDLMKGLKGGYSFSCRSGLNAIYKSYYLKDYKKTWWLKGERDEKES